MRMNCALSVIITLQFALQSFNATGGIVDDNDVAQMVHLTFNSSKQLFFSAQRTCSSQNGSLLTQSTLEFAISNSLENSLEPLNLDLNNSDFWMNKYINSHFWVNGRDATNTAECQALVLKSNGSFYYDSCTNKHMFICELNVGKPCKFEEHVDTTVTNLELGMYGTTATDDCEELCLRSSKCFGYMNCSQTVHSTSWCSFFEYPTAGVKVQTEETSGCSLFRKVCVEFVVEMDTVNGSNTETNETHNSELQTARTAQSTPEMNTPTTTANKHMWSSYYTANVSKKYTQIFTRANKTSTLRPTKVTQYTHSLTDGETIPQGSTIKDVHITLNTTAEDNVSREILTKDIKFNLSKSTDDRIITKSQDEGVQSTIDDLSSQGISAGDYTPSLTMDQQHYSRSMGFSLTGMNQISMLMTNAPQLFSSKDYVHECTELGSPCSDSIDSLISTTFGQSISEVDIFNSIQATPTIISLPNGQTSITIYSSESITTNSGTFGPSRPSQAVLPITDFGPSGIDIGPKLSTQTPVPKSDTSIVEEPSRPIFCRVTYANNLMSTVDRFFSKVPAYCSCQYKLHPGIPILTKVERSEMMDKIMSSLSVNKTAVSATRRKYTSAVDNRPTSVGVGSVGVALLLVFALLILAFDLIGLLQHFSERRLSRSRRNSTPS